MTHLLTAAPKRRLGGRRVHQEAGGQRRRRPASRLMFALDAAASREPVGIRPATLPARYSRPPDRRHRRQAVYYRGYGEYGGPVAWFRRNLHNLMRSVSCVGGYTRSIVCSVSRSTRPKR